MLFPTLLVVMLWRCYNQGSKVDILLLDTTSLVWPMGRYTTVSAKIDTKLKEKIVKYNISISKVIKKALEEEIKRREEKELNEMLKEASRILSRVGRENIIQIMVIRVYWSIKGAIIFIIQQDWSFLKIVYFTNRNILGLLFLKIFLGHIKRGQCQ